MGWQEPAALAIVAATAGLFVWRLVRPRRFFSRGGSPCGCASPASNPHAPRIIFRARKGERSQVVVKMK